LNLNLVWKETYRVLKPGCRLCINIGDQFARAAYYGRYKIIPIRTEIIKFCEIIGFDYMGAIIWQKVTTTNTTGGAVIMGSYPYPRNGILKLDYEFILIFKKYGDSDKVIKEIKEESKLSSEEWNELFSGHWNFPGEKQQKNLAVFPIELPSRLTKMYSFVGDTILDPFLGSGTTCVSAKNLKRNSVGIEINEKLVPVIKSRMNINKSSTFHKIEILHETKQSDRFNFVDEIKKLSYIFKDPHCMNKKVDIKKQTYGSKVDHSQKKEEDFYTIRKVISPNLVVLSNNKNLKLLGVEVHKQKKLEAIQFLRQKINSNKVIVKFDKDKYDKDNNWQGYLYLKNKTFLNAHLIKTGLAKADQSIIYKHRKRFISYQNAVKLSKKVQTK
jgi:site-specific DNA-methyltransferase (adenine-specific)